MKGQKIDCTHYPPKRDSIATFRPVQWGLMVFVLFVFGGCTEQQQANPKEETRPVKTMLIADLESRSVRTFPATIAAAQRAELSFRVGGVIQELSVKEGDDLKKGALVALLDPTDFRIVANDRSATFERTRKDFDRAKELVAKGYISKTDYDKLEAAFKNAQAALDSAKQDLEYTELRAPFDGMVARRLVQQHEEIQAKQPILQVQNIDELEVKFNVPETVIRSIRVSRDDRKEVARDGIRVFVTFDDYPGREYPLAFKEIAAKADPATQTFEATYLMNQWEQGIVLPGMTASVTVDLSAFIQAESTFTVPVSAVVGDQNLEPRVWIVDDESMTVSSRPVRIGKMHGNVIEVLEGLEPGLRIVTAGTPFLVEGMKVALIANTEQAAPRAEDLEYQK